MDLLVILGIRPSEPLPLEHIDNDRVKEILQGGGSTATVYVRIADQPDWHQKASSSIPFRIIQCAAPSGATSATFRNNAGAYAFVHSCELPHLQAEVPEAEMIDDERLLQTMQALCNDLEKAQTSADSRGRKRRVQNACRNLGGILKSRRGPAPTLLNLAGRQSFLEATSAFLRDAQDHSGSVLPSLGTWCTVPTVRFTAWLKPGASGDTRQALLLLLRQLQQKVHFAVQHGVAHSVKGAVVRTADHRRSDGEHVARLLMVEDAGEANPKNCYMWVCPRPRLEHLLAQRAPNVWEAGTLHIVVSMSNIKGNQLSLQPVFDPAVSPEGTEVCTVQLADIHEFVFLFHAIVAACRTRAPPSPLQLASTGLLALFGDGPAAPAFQAWMGTGPEQPATPVWDDLLGPDRQQLFTFAQGDLGLTLTQGQQQVFHSLRGVLTVLNNFAGGGKTTLLSLLALYLVKEVQRRPEGSRPLVFFVSTTKRVVHDFVQQLQPYVAPETWAMLGFDEVEGEDLFQKHLQGAADSKFEEFACAYNLLDAMLDQIHTWLVNMVGPVLTEPGNIRRLALLLLAWRGFHLQTTVYDVLSQVKQEAVKKLVLIGSTTSYMAKLAAMSRGWARDLKERRKFILLQDEYMSEPSEREAINLLDFQAALLAGDPHQSVARRPQLSADAASLLHLGSRLEQPLQWHPALTWLENHKHAHHILNTETFRTGEPAMGCLKSIFGDELAACTSKAQHSTWMIPVLFYRVSDWVTKGYECQASLTLFLSIAMVLAAEALRSLRQPKPTTVVVTAFLLKQLRALEAFVQIAVPQICVVMQAMAGMTGVTAGQVQAILEHWQFRGPYSVGGANADVAVCLGVRRQSADKAWRGLALERPLVYTALTRAKHRAYIFLEDLREEVLLPHHGPQANEGRLLGLRNFAGPQKNLTGAAVTAHLLWTRAVWACIRIFENDFGQPAWWSCRAEIPWLFWNSRWQSMLGLAHPAIPAGVENLLTTLFHGMVWPQEESNEELASTVFTQLALPTFEAHHRPRPSAAAFEHRVNIRPPAEVVQQFWTALAIDNMAVCYGIKDATIQVPLMAYMSPETWAWLLLPDELPEVRAAVADPNYMAELLVARALELFLPTQAAADIRARGATLESATTVHKWEPVTVGTSEYYIPQCRSERPAYVVRAAAGDDRWELLHTYCCMGLEKAHPFQQVILSRCRSHELAQCVMLAASDLFGYHINKQLVCSLVPEEAKAKTDVENQWSQFVNNHSGRQQRALPDFQSHSLREDIAAAAPPELRQACLDLLAALP